MCVLNYLVVLSVLATWFEEATCEVKYDLHLVGRARNEARKEKESGVRWQVSQSKYRCVSEKEAVRFVDFSRAIKQFEGQLYTHNAAMFEEFCNLDYVRPRQEQEDRLDS